MSATGRAAPAAAGFTLLEMLVVLAIMALVAGLGFPAVERLLARASLIEARHQLVAELSEARAGAVRGGRAAGFVVDPATGTLTHDDGLRVALPGGVEIASVPAGVRFFADGSANAVDLRLRTATLSTTVGVEPARGRLSVGPILATETRR